MDDFQKIATALLEINQTLKSQSNEILELRNQVQNLIQAKTPSSNCAVIEPDCGYEWMWARIQLDADTWSRIKSGERVTLKGKGSIPLETKTPNPNDENFYWDYWEFNGRINKPMKLSMENPDDHFDDPDDLIAYEGHIDPSFIISVRKKLHLDQREAAEIFGGGVNAFSRYENGKTQPPLALVKLLKVLDKHPDMLEEIKVA